jgi:6,7-dimethyl-8-ribityllumazine synthase
MTIHEGLIRADGRSVAIVVGRFNSFVTEKLYEGAVDCFERHGGRNEDITLVRVPGSWEIPLAAKKLAARKRFDAIVCLGAVIRGETPHFDYVAAEVGKGVASVSLDTEVPIAFGVLTTDTVEQAVDRAGAKAGNKGFDAMMSALEMSSVLASIQDRT